MRKRDKILKRDREFEKEQKNYEKIQRATERKDWRALERWVGNFGEGKKDWLD